MKMSTVLENICLKILNEFEPCGIRTYREEFDMEELEFLNNSSQIVNSYVLNDGTYEYIVVEDDRILFLNMDDEGKVFERRVMKSELNNYK